ncbi:MAG TPA: GNAT family N-acetyltransferase [Syntrophales bacterium]|nr:GNAT family N-acetyltransferase [Syntrophales bacterium]
MSLPFTDHCDPLFTGIPFRSLFDAAVETGRERSWKILETRTTWDPFGTVRPYETFLGHVLDLTAGEERIFSRFSGATRRNLRKAGREGVEVSIGNSWGDTAEYYRLHCLTRKKHGLPPQPLKFFKKIQEHVISKHGGAVFLARRGGKSAAGAVFFHFHDGVLYKFGASDPELQEFRASNGVMGEAIRHYAGRGFRHLCFGRTEPGNEGLRRFKLGWGPEERTIYYHRYGILKKALLAGEPPRSPRWNRLFGKLPIPVLQIIGRAVYGFMA